MRRSAALRLPANGSHPSRRKSHAAPAIVTAVTDVDNLYKTTYHQDNLYKHDSNHIQAKAHTPISINILEHLSSLVMRRTGGQYNGMAGYFDSSRGDLRLFNVTVGAGGRSYMSYLKVPQKLQEFCDEMNERRE